MLDRIDPINYYKTRIITMMSTWEDHTGKIFDTEYPELADQFYAYSDNKDHKMLSYLCNEIAKIIDAEAGQ